MRDIKIKFWDVDNKCMHHWIENFEEIAIVNGKMKPVLNNSVSDNWNWYKRNYEPLQYTGLKDKNGKEIYEGDVIKQTYHKTIGYGDNEENFEGYHIGEVVLISSGVCIKKPLMYEVEIDQLVKLDGYKNVAGYRSEVIGNIYENPELLEGN